MPDSIDEFTLEPGLIYLNHAAVSPWPRRTAVAVQRFAENNVRRGSLDYPDWLDTESRLRERLARLVNAPGKESIALVKNTSEALSFVAYGLDWRAGDNVVSSDEEFPSNRIVWESLSEQGVVLKQASLTEGGDPEEALLAQVDDCTRMIAVSSVQYASGVRLDLERLGRFCRDRGILFCIDAIQSIGAVRLDVQACHADFVMADGHKWMLGPEGLGLFYCSPQHIERLRLSQYGWHMVEHIGDYDRSDWQPAADARRFECGSPNMLGIHALETSLSLLEEIGLEEVERRVLANSRYLLDAIDAIPELEPLTPSQAGRHAGIVTFRHRDQSAETLHERLTREGVFCAVRGGGIRFSPHYYTPRSSLQRAMEVVSG